MTSCIFFACGFVLFLSFSFGGMTFSSIHRAFLNLNKSVLEISVNTIDSNGEDRKPFFNQAVLEDYVIRYLKNNINKYTTDYHVKITYLDASNGGLNFNGYPDQVTISLLSEINTFYTYKHSRTFTILTNGEIYE